MPTPEDLARQFVIVAVREVGGSHYVRLAAPDGEAVLLGPYPNPALARDKADAVRRFVAATIRAVADPTLGSGPQPRPAEGTC